jgi:formamidopyrimidine-DNA glycosylase
MIAGLGVEPLSEALDVPYLEKQFATRAAPIKQVLLDQRVVAGIGNIYACEALFRCCLHPATPARDCIPAVPAVIVAIRAVLEEAIASGGSTLRNYASASGDKGYFQHHFAVYGRASQPCLNCGTLIARIVQAGRSSFFCPSCQPESVVSFQKTCL